MNFTVIGGKGFIGRHLVVSLNNAGIKVFVPEKDDQSIFTAPLGHVIYCAGVTSDYRTRLFDTVKAHVSHFCDLLEHADYDSLLYVSSTRIYIHNNIGEELCGLYVNPNELEDLFNISKIMGESICLARISPNIKVARLSNVYGDDFKSNNFLFSIIKDAINKNNIILQTNLDSEKDYININDVAEILVKIALYGKKRLYNVASGINMSHGEIIQIIQSVTGCNLEIAKNSHTIKFPKINIDSIKEEFGFTPRRLHEDLEELINYYRMKRGD